MAWRAIDDLRQQQALAVSYFDCFFAFAVLTRGWFRWPS